MLSLDAGQTALLTAGSKIIRWSFTVTDNAATSYTYITDDGAGSDILISDFSGIELRRNMAENTVIAPSDVSFTISNPANAMDFADFKGGSVLIELYLSTNGTAYTKIAGWKFRIKTAQPEYQKLKITAEDYLQYYLQGYYPNTRLPEEIFPSNRTYSNDGTCIPVPFGTAYIPLRDVFVAGGVVGTVWDTPVVWAAGIAWEEAGSGEGGFLMLGETGTTYTITKIRNPRSTGLISQWTSASYEFVQYTKADAGGTDWRVFKAVIADSDNDGTADSHGFWGASGGAVLDPPVQFTRSDTATMTNPADIIEFVLEDMGIPSAMIDAVTFAAAEAVYTGWGLEFNGAFWYKQKREKVLAGLLSQCHSCLLVGEKIELHVMSGTSVKTITGAEVLRNSDQGEGTFTYRDIVNSDLSDSGYVAWQTVDEAQDSFLKTLVAADGGSTATIISNSILEAPFIQDSEVVKKVAILHFQRKLLKEGEAGFIGKSTCLVLQPDDIITINAANYGGNYEVLVDSVKINKDLSVQIGASKYVTAFDDWADLTTLPLVVATDGSAGSWQPVISGPDDGVGTNVLPGRIRIGQTSSYILFDPNDPLRISIYDAATEVFRAGNLNNFLDYVTDTYGFALGDAVSYLKYDAVNGIRLAGTVTIEGGIDWEDVLDGSGTKPADNATVGADWASNLGNIPVPLTTPSGTGLFLSANYMGYYTDSAWKTYIKNDGTFAFAGDADNYVAWNGATLSIKGSITLTAGSVPWSLVDDDGNAPADNADVTLSAINGGLTVTGGGITLSAGGSIKGGMTDYMTGTGFFLGYTGSDYKFSIGDANNYVAWNGTTLIIAGEDINDINDQISLINQTLMGENAGYIGLFGGGDTGSVSNVQDYVVISTTGNATDFGDLTVARKRLGACASPTRGVFGGGDEASLSDVIDYVTFLVPGSAVDFGNLTVTRYGLAGLSSSVRGIFGGGFTTGSVNIVDYIAIASPGNATDFGDLTVSRRSLASCASSTRGVFAGGYTSAISDVMDYVTISTTGSVTDFGDLLADREGLAGLSSSTRGIFAGGYAVAELDSSEYITIATKSNAGNFGDLTVARQALAACTSLTRGLFGGGYAGGGQSAIDYYTIATLVAADEFGDLSVTRSSLAGCSDCHGGLA